MTLDCIEMSPLIVYIHMPENFITQQVSRPIVGLKVYTPNAATD